MLQKCGFLQQNCIKPLLYKYISIKSLLYNDCIDIVYRSLFSFIVIRDILSMVINMEINNKLVGKRIKHRREAAGLSQEQLAEQLNLSKNHISSMECGKSMLTTKCLLTLCDVLGGTPNYYLLGEIVLEPDPITALVMKLSPNEQNKLVCLLRAYLESN